MSRFASVAPPSPGFSLRLSLRNGGNNNAVTHIGGLAVAASPPRSSIMQFECHSPKTPQQLRNALERMEAAAAAAAARGGEGPTHYGK